MTRRRCAVVVAALATLFFASSEAQQQQTACQQAYASAVNGTTSASPSAAFLSLRAAAATYLADASDAHFAPLPAAAAELMQATWAAVPTGDVVDSINVFDQLEAAETAFDLCTRAAPYVGALAISASEPLPFSSPGDDALLGNLDLYAQVDAIGFFEDRLKNLSLPAMRKLLLQRTRLEPRRFTATGELLVEFSSKAHRHYMETLTGSTRCAEAAAYLRQTRDLAEVFFRADEPASAEAGVRLEALLLDTFGSSLLDGLLFGC